MSVPREPPYPPPPRQAPIDLGRGPVGSAVSRYLGLAAHLFGVALYTAAPLAALWLAARVLQATGWFLGFRLLGFIVCLTLALVYLKSLLPRRLPVPASVVPIQPDEQPLVHAFIARVADDVGAGPPGRIVITSGTDLRLGGRVSLVDLVHRPDRELLVGLWLWHGLTLSEFQALVARALAPLGRGRLERFRFDCRGLLEALTDGQDAMDEAAKRTRSAFATVTWMAGRVHAAAVAPFRALGRLLLRVGPVRDEVLVDDLAAVRVAGSDAVVHAVLRSDFAGASLREIDEALGLAARKGVFTRDLYAHFAEAATMVREAHNDFTLGEPPFLRGPTAGKHADVFEPAQRYLCPSGRRLPGPSEREHNAKRTFVAAERDDRPATDLLDDPARLRERLTSAHAADVFRAGADSIPLPPEAVRLWLNTRADEPLAARYDGCYDGGRRVQPGPREERDSAVAAAAWDDIRLLSMARGLYASAGDRAARWRATRTALDRLLWKTLYRPTGRERAYAEDLEEDLRKAARWLAALDRWVYVVHVHMAARLTDLGLHDELLNRYESVLRLQPFAADAREYRNRVAAFVRRLEDLAGVATFGLTRDAGREFDSSRKDFNALLAESGAVDDPFLREWTGGVRFDRFLYAHESRPARADLSETEFGRRLLDAWAEVAAKAAWVHRQGVTALLSLHERILAEFLAMVGPQPDVGPSDPMPPPVREAILLEPKPEPMLEEPEIVEEPPGGPTEEPPDPWAVR